jgi:hypothetical protein
MHESERLKSDILNYIVKSKDGMFTSMIASSEWMQWSAQNEKLASDIIKEIFKKFGIEKY